MPRVIYLGLQAFAHEPHQLLPAAENPLACESLVDISETDALAPNSTCLLSTLNDEDVVRLRAWCKHDAERQLMIAWPQPDAWLAASLANGAVAEEAINDWLAQAKRLLALFRSARRQITLVGYSPGRISKLIDAPLDLPTTATDKAIYQLAAAYLCGQSQALQDTYPYLVASSQECTDYQQTKGSVLLEDALAEYLFQKSQLMAADQAKQELEKENDLLLEQLHSVQERLEKRSTEQKENGLLLEQLHSVQERLEKRSTEHRQVQKMNEEKQLRIIRYKVKLEKENAVLLQQLHDTQEAYETLYNERKSLSNQLLTACNKSKQKLEKSTLDQLRLHQQLEKRQKELNILRADTQRHISHLERLVQWLRVHAQRHAAVAYRDSRSYKKELPKQLAMLEATPFFDADWYLAQYPDVAKSGIKPAEHFIKFGAIDGRQPSSQFSTNFYLTHYKDVAASGQHPLLHYLRHGIAEQRKTQPPQHHLPAPKTPTEGSDA